MYLKKIEIIGFKSFADKVKIEFNDGITGIVGPNGSGKSNITDAIRWVLGEQSTKTLRSSKMEDIIFSGTDFRNQQNYAMVSLTLDNKDKFYNIPYENLEISRKVYRSGDSEYYINNKSARLKDILEILVGTGIGKEGYSIISQGQVDKILSVRYEDKREIFDEFTGISKDKIKKAKALNDLEKVASNLSQVELLLDELKVQKDILEKEAEVAKKYLYLTSKLKIIEVTKTKKDLEIIQNKSKEILENKNIIDEELRALEIEYKNILKIIDSENLNKNNIDKNIDKNNIKISEINILITRLEEKIKYSLEKSESTVENIEKIDKEILDISKKVNNILLEQTKLKDDIEKFDNEIVSLNLKIVSLERDEKSINNDLIKIQYELKINQEKYNYQIVEKNKKENEYKLKLEIINEKKLHLSEKISFLSRFDFEKKEKEELLNLSKKEQEKINYNYSEIELKISNFIKTIDELTNEMNIIEKLKKDNSYKLIEYETKLEKYSIRENNDAIKTILDLNKIGVYGLVGDIIKTNQKYEKAIEISLGNSINNIITDTEDTIKECIDVIKNKNNGRVTFLPINIIKGKILDIEIEDGIIGVASDLVDVSDEYKDIVLYLLGKVVIVDNINNALLVAKKYKYKFRIVTLDGENIAVGGAITAGSSKKTNILKIKRKKNELIEKIENLKFEINNTEIKFLKVKDKLESNKKIKSDFEKNLIEYSRKKMEISFEISKLEQEIENLDIEKEKANKEINKIKLEIKEPVKDFEIYDLEIESLLKKIDVLKKDEEKIYADKTVFTDRLLELNKEKIQIQNDVKFFKATYSKNQENLIELENKDKELKKLKERYFLQKDEFIDNISVFKSDLIKSKEELEQLTVLKNDLFIKKKENEIKLTEINNDKQNIYEKISLLEKRNIKNFENIESNNKQIELLKMNIYNNYGEQYDDIVDKYYDDKEDISNLKNIKDEINSLGSVNVLAVEKYNEISERVNNLLFQIDDIKKSENMLLDLIKELDEMMVSTFKREFEKVNKKFNEVFSELFLGGNASLILENDDVLDAKIKINVKPPGKKLVNIMQMSGGEKALTAIALLFAILSLKPSPFCVLDEIEAALDDVNITRFANFLQRLKKETQFIVVTHRKGTMEKMDRLYGVVMEEKGVTKILSLELKDAKEWGD